MIMDNNLPVLNYDHEPSIVYVTQTLGMGWDADFAARVDQVAHHLEITQEQFEVMVREYAWRIKTMFHPRSYTYWQRILMALYFINPFISKLSQETKGE